MGGCDLYCTMGERESFIYLQITATKTNGARWGIDTRSWWVGTKDGRIVIVDTEIAQTTNWVGLVRMVNWGQQGVNNDNDLYHKNKIWITDDV